MAKSKLITVDENELRAIVAQSVGMAIGLKQKAEEFEDQRPLFDMNKAIEFTGLKRHQIYRLHSIGHLPSRTINKCLFFTPEDLKKFVVKEKEVQNG